MSLKRGKRSAGRSSYSLAGGQTKQVSVKLKAGTRRALKRKGKVKLKFTITAKGSGKKTFSTKGKLTVKSPKKARKKRKKGGGTGGVRDGMYGGSPNVSFRVADGRVVGFFGTLTPLPTCRTGSGGGFNDSSKRSFKADSPAISATGSFTGNTSVNGAVYEYKGQFGSNNRVSGTMLAIYSTSRTEFVSNIFSPGGTFQFVLYQCKGSNGWAAEKGKPPLQAP